MRDVFVVPDYVPGTSFTGYRSFRLPRKGRKLLRSAFFDTEWPTSTGGGIVAACHMRTPQLDGLMALLRKVKPPRPCAHSPGAKCPSNHPCGIYAYNSRLALSDATLHGPVFGEVQLAGKIFHHEKGYRASHAIVTAVYDKHPKFLHQMSETAFHERLAEVADYYEIPLVQWDP